MIRQLTYKELLFVGQVIGYPPPMDAKAIAEFKDGELQCAIIYDRWTHSAVQMHVWAPKQFSREFLSEMFRYPFEEGSRELLIVMVAEHVKSRETALRLGFKETYRIKGGWSEDDDLVILELRKHECRWIRKRAA